LQTYKSLSTGQKVGAKKSIDCDFLLVWKSLLSWPPNYVHAFQDVVAFTKDNTLRAVDGNKRRSQRAKLRSVNTGKLKTMMKPQPSVALVLLWTQRQNNWLDLCWELFSSALSTALLNSWPTII
jgi:hypothetical protein